MRRRLVLAIVAVATCAVGLFAVPLALVLRDSYTDEELARLQRDTLVATREIDLGPGGDPVEVPRGSDLIGVYGPHGRLVAGRGPRTADTVARSTLADGRPAERAEDGRLVVAVPLVGGERVAGAVRAARDDDGVAARIRRAWLELGALAVALVGAAALAALLLSRRLAQPLERLAGSARRLGEGDFAARSPASGVPEVDEVGAALDATARRLDELVARERAFSADASHQLRTPLAALRIELEALELRGETTPELTAALAQVDRLEATVETLLSLARDVPRRTGRADLQALVDDAERRWRPLLAARARPLRTSVSAEEPVAAAAPAVVTEVLDVLVSNADRHGAGAVTVSVRRVQGWLAVEVADEGPGWPAPPDDPFRRRAEAADGHGIGLALARSLAHAEGGRLTLTSAGPQPVLTLWLPPAP